MISGKYLTKSNVVFFAAVLLYARMLEGGDWQHCRQKPMFWCTQMCGSKGGGPGGHGKCSITGLCVCPPTVIPPPSCKKPLSYDYHEMVNCHLRSRFCTFDSAFEKVEPNPSSLSNSSVAPFVCVDIHQKKIRQDQRLMKYCVCFQN